LLKKEKGEMRGQADEYSAQFSLTLTPGEIYHASHVRNMIDNDGFVIIPKYSCDGVFL
jgi:hypothetical protein